MQYLIEVVQSDGSKDRHPIEGGQVTVGKSGVAGISIPAATELELEHLLVAPKGKEGCWVSTTDGASTPTLLKGKPFRSGMVPWGSEFRIGRTTLRVLTKTGASKSGDGPSPVLLLALVGALGYMAYTFLEHEDSAVTSSDGLSPPELFAGLDESCPQGPRNTAPEIEYRAHSRGDRFHYELADGVEAVKLYRQAATCYTAGGNGGDATRMRHEADHLQTLLESDYGARRIRLSHAIEVEDWRAAAIETDALMSMTRHLNPEDSWLEWLERTHRDVQARADTVTSTEE